VWAKWTKRQLLEHYPDAVRQERRQWMHLQGMLLEKKGFEAQDWDWLDALEQHRWCPDAPEPVAKMSPADAFAAARNRPVTDEDRAALAEFMRNGGGMQSFA